MSDVLLTPANGLASLLTALQPGSAPLVPPLDLDAIRDEACRAGRLAGEAEATATLEPQLTRLAAAATALEGACQIDATALRPLIVTLVRQLAEAVLAAELSAGAAVLVPLADAALAALRPGTAPTLVAHPDTLAALRAHLPELPTEADPVMPPDSFRLLGPDFVIDAGLAARLAEIIEAMA